MLENLAQLEVWGDYAVKFAVTAILSGVIGLERLLSHKTAGMRTHMLVSVGALMFTLIGVGVVDSGGGQLPHESLRLIQAIIGGLGFLGGGAIIQSRGDVKGLTTATSIWTMGALGVSVAVGNYVLAVLFVIISFVVLTIIDRFENKALDKQDEMEESKDV